MEVVFTCRHLEIISVRYDTVYPSINIVIATFIFQSVYEMKIKFVLFERTLEMIKELHL